MSCYTSLSVCFRRVGVSSCQRPVFKSKAPLKLWNTPLLVLQALPLLCPTYGVVCAQCSIKAQRSPYGARYIRDINLMAQQRMLDHTRNRRFRRLPMCQRDNPTLFRASVTLFIFSKKCWGKILTVLARKHVKMPELYTNTLRVARRTNVLFCTGGCTRLNLVVLWKPCTAKKHQRRASKATLKKIMIHGAN